MVESGKGVEVAVTPLLIESLRTWVGAALSAAGFAALEASLLPDAEQQWLLDAPAVERPAEAGPSLTLGSLVERTSRRAQNGELSRVMSAGAHRLSDSGRGSRARGPRSRPAHTRWCAR